MNRSLQVANILADVKEQKSLNRTCEITKKRSSSGKLHRSNLESISWQWISRKTRRSTTCWTTNSLWVDQYLCSITSCFEFPFNPRCSDYRFYIEIRMGLSKIRWRNWISGLEAWCRLCNRSHPPNCVFFCSGNVSENVRLDERVFLIIRYANFLNWKTPVINDWWCLREDYGWV